jgi:hypothetical protein
MAHNRLPTQECVPGNFLQAKCGRLEREADKLTIVYKMWEPGRLTTCEFQRPLAETDFAASRF